MIDGFANYFTNTTVHWRPTSAVAPRSLERGDVPCNERRRLILAARLALLDVSLSVPCRSAPKRTSLARPYLAWEVRA